MSHSLNYFFSFTENAFEISIVANKQVIDQDFIPPLTMTQCHDMKYSNDIYRVLQVDDEGGQGKVYTLSHVRKLNYCIVVGASGKRISDISEPLAQGKFSIFYMSTYQTDYVLVNVNKRLNSRYVTLYI